MKKKTKKGGCRSECIPCCKEYYDNNRDRLLNNRKNSNKRKREKRKNYEKRGRRIDFNLNLAHNIRVTTRQAFESQNLEKLNKTFDSIGCSHSF